MTHVLPPLVAITTDALANVLEGRGFTVCLLGDTSIAGERQAGERTYEELSFTKRPGLNDWIGSWTSRELTDVIMQNGFAVPVYSHQVLLLSKAMESLDDLFNWLQLLDFTEEKFV